MNYNTITTVVAATKMVMTAAAITMTRRNKYV
jgi:hypothetical protein